MVKTEANANSGDVAKTTPMYDDETLGNVKSFDDAMALIRDNGVAVTDITDYGDGFVVAEKDSLVNSPFVILDYKFIESTDYSSNGQPNSYASIRVVTQDGRKLVLNDGGTGVCRQVRDLDRRGVTGGVFCPQGLSKSEYDYYDDKGNKSKAATFYLSN